MAGVKGQGAQPAKILQLMGSKVTGEEPTPEDGVFELPGWLDKAPDESEYKAKWQAKWEEVTHYLKLTQAGYPIDAPLVSAYVTTVLKLAEAEDVLTRIGLLVRNPDGTYAPNPMSPMFAKLTAQLTSLSRELALSPSGRAARRTMKTDVKPATVSSQANQRPRRSSPHGFA